MDIKRILIKTEEDFNNLILESQKHTVVSFDTENGGPSKIVTLNQKFTSPAGFSVSFDGVTGYYVPINHMDIKTDFHTKISNLFENKQKIIMWHAVYDALVSKFQYKFDMEHLFWFDGMIAQHLVDENNPKGLKDNTKKFLGVEQQSFKWDDIRQARAEDVYEYACDDAIYTFKHYERLWKELQNEDLLEFYIKIEEPFLKTLCHLRSNGILFDKESCNKLENELKEDKERLIQAMIKVTPQIKCVMDLMNPDKKNPTISFDSSEDLKSLLFDKLNLPIIEKTPAGAPAVGTPALEKLKKEDKFLHPIIPLLIKYNEVQKLLSTYTHSLFDLVMEDGRIYADLKAHGARTGRLSCENPNFQNLAKSKKIKDLVKEYETYSPDALKNFFLKYFSKNYKVRNLFIASPGYKMFVPDFSQQELMVCGVMANCPVFQKVFAEGQDMHLKVANTVWALGIPEEELIKSHPNYEKHTKDFYTQRFKAKSINFGSIYGIGEYGLAQLTNTSTTEAKQMLEGYFETFPAVKQAMLSAQEDVRIKGFTRNMYGRKRRFEKDEKGQIPKKALKQAFNFKIQGSCADILRIVMNALYSYIKTTNDELRILTTVHDEIMFEIKENENYEKHKLKVIDIMENTVKLKIPLKVDGSDGYNYGDCK